MSNISPAKLMCSNIIPDSIEVRSSYIRDANSIVYEQGLDYSVDYKNGTLQRTPDSRIPDYSHHILYGKKDFDHEQYRAYENHPFFTWIDYTTWEPLPYGQITPLKSLFRQTYSNLVSGKPYKIIVFGDSISTGAETTDLEFAYFNLYARYLEMSAPGAVIRIENRSVSGESSRHGMNRLQQDVLNDSPDLVIIAFGMNDNNLSGTDPNEFERNLTFMADAIKSAVNSDIIFLSAFPPNPNWHYSSNKMQIYAASTRKVARATRCAYADVYGLWTRIFARKDCSNLLGNNINHPNNFGHFLYCEAIKSARIESN